MRDLNVLEMRGIAGGNGTQSVVVSGKEALERLRAEEAAEAAEFARFMDNLVYEAELAEGSQRPLTDAQKASNERIRQADAEEDAKAAMKADAEQKIKDRELLNKLADKMAEEERKKREASCTSDKVGDLITVVIKSTLGEIPIVGDLIKEALPVEHKPLVTPVCPKKSNE